MEGDNFYNIYKFICKKFAIPPFKLLGRKLCPSGLVEPCVYYANYDLTPEDISAGAKGFATTIFFIIIGISAIWPLAPLLYLAFALLVTYISHGLLIRFLPLKYKYERLTIEKYADLILKTMLLALLATGSPFTAIYFVANSNFPIVSNDFKNLLYRVNNNEPPEKLLFEYSQKQPSPTLKKHISMLFAVRNFETELIDMLKDSSQFEIRTAYDQFTLELESRLALVIGISTFFPITLGLCLITYGLATSVYILFTVPIHIALLHILKSQILKSKVELVG